MPMDNVEELRPSATGPEAQARCAADLAKSGLTVADIKARPLTPAEKQATNTPMGLDGYVIPYFDMWGNPVQFYRVKLYGTAEPKYRQMLNSTNHIYFPPGLKALLPTAKYLLWTEGEKKAGAAVKHGFPCIGVGGVDSWRNRTLILNKSTKLAQSANSGSIVARLPAGSDLAPGLDTVATGFQEVADFIISRNIPLIICYDADVVDKEHEHATPGSWSSPVKREVQQAAASLGFELRFRGVPVRHIRQHVLDVTAAREAKLDKVGLDDFLLLDHPRAGPIGLSEGLHATLAKRSAFPVHPNPRKLISDKLQKSNISRKEAQQVSMTILSDLDARGQRLRDINSGALYYFNNQDRNLISVELSNELGFAETPFGRHLYEHYGISHADRRVVDWLAAQFSGEKPIQEVSPEKVLAWRGDRLHYQLNDGQQVIVTADNIQIVDNGEQDVLFKSGLVDNIEEDIFRSALAEVRSRPWSNWWLDVLREARIRDTEDQRYRRLLALHYYISPWFYKWRGTQLPVEIVTGEPGSGKSTLYQLRLGIGTGIPKLRNPPKDLRDWTSTLAHVGGLHVTDNVQFVDNHLRQQLSDEICRLITEPDPAIEQRKLYTDNTIIRMPIKAVFGITSVKQPFTNVDIVQRAIITEMDKGSDPNLVYDGRWEEKKLQERGGRPAWLAHHLLVIQRILQQNQKNWANNYNAKYRLINVEQLLIRTAEVFGEDTSWIQQFLERTRNQQTEAGDWALQGLHTFANEVRAGDPEYYKHSCKPSQIVEWASSHPDYERNEILTNPRTLGRYLQTHQHQIAITTGIYCMGNRGNANIYGIREAPKASVDPSK